MTFCSTSRRLVLALELEELQELQAEAQQLRQVRAERNRRAQHLRQTWAQRFVDGREERGRIERLAELGFTEEDFQLPPVRFTACEQQLYDLLTQLGIVFQIQVRFDRYLADAYLPDLALIIEADGSYWHSLPGKPEKDRLRDLWFLERGMQTLRLGEFELAQMAAQELANKIGEIRAR